MIKVKILFQDLPGGIEEYNGNPQSGGPRFKLETAWIRVKSANQFTMMVASLFKFRSEWRSGMNHTVPSVGKSKIQNNHTYPTAGWGFFTFIFIKKNGSCLVFVKVEWCITEWISCNSFWENRRLTSVLYLKTCISIWKYVQISNL